MWPDYFPDSCPPLQARKDEVKVFRLVDNTPPSSNDFRPTIIEHPHRDFKSEDLCIACGVSVFKKLEDALNRRRRFKPLRDKRIAIGTITQDDGLILETCSDSHMTWWLQTDSPHKDFQEVDGNV